METLEETYRVLMKDGGMALSEIEQADYHFLLRLFNKNMEENENVSRETPDEFFRKFLSPEDIAELEK